jgi:hypothetical protein
VRISGLITEWSSTRFEVDDGSGPAVIYIREETGIKGLGLRAGDPVTVTGLMSQYVASQPYEGGYRILARYRSDIRAGPDTLPVTGAETPE